MKKNKASILYVVFSVHAIHTVDRVAEQPVAKMTQRSSVDDRCVRVHLSFIEFIENNGWTLHVRQHRCTAERSPADPVKNSRYFQCLQLKDN